MKNLAITYSQNPRSARAIMPRIFNLAGALCSVTQNSGSCFAGFRIIFFGFTATACRSIFATVFAQLCASDITCAIVLRPSNAPTGDKLI